MDGEPESRADKGGTKAATRGRPSWLRRLAAVLVGSVFAFALLEVLLRIHNPLPARIRGDEIILPANLRKVIQLEDAPGGLDKRIVHTWNSLGLRGPEPPADWESRYTIIAVGGSTTECSLLDDHKAWPRQFGRMLEARDPRFWVNNAGIDGCSTYGHIILLRDYLLKMRPDMILFLIGINDIGRTRFDHEDGFLQKRDEAYWRTLLKKSEAVMLATNLLRTWRAHRMNLTHGANTNAGGKSSAKEERDFRKGIAPYRKRVETLVRMCREAEITPVLLTQPLLTPAGDPSWDRMEVYNDVTRSVAREDGVTLVDLARLLPKAPAYFYDSLHYTNAGARAVAGILDRELHEKLLEALPAGTTTGRSPPAGPSP